MDLSDQQLMLDSYLLGNLASALSAAGWVVDSAFPLELSLWFKPPDAIVGAELYRLQIQRENR